MKTSDAIAGTSLFVAALAFGYTVWASRRERTNRREEIKNVLQARRAVIIADKTTGRRRSYEISGQDVQYAVELHNAGRATARRVTAELLDAQERGLSRKEIAILPPEQTQYVEFWLGYDDPPASALRVEWQDEDGRQSDQMAL